MTIEQLSDPMLCIQMTVTDTESFVPRGQEHENFADVCAELSGWTRCDPVPVCGWGCYTCRVTFVPNDPDEDRRDYLVADPEYACIELYSSLDNNNNEGD